MKTRTFKHDLVLAQNAPDFVRSPGLHMSDIYNSLYKQLDPKRYDKRDEDGNPEELNRAKIEAGSGLETRLEPLIAQKWGGCRPGEFFTQHALDCSAHGRPVRDGCVLCHCGAGVAFSPDWLFDDIPVFAEFKFSWYSAKDFPNDPKFDKWMTQVKSYGYHLRMDTVWMFPYWVNGLYPCGTPSPLFDDVYELQFDEKELWNCWLELRRHAWKEGLIP